MVKELIWLDRLVSLVVLFDKFLLILGLVLLSRLFLKEGVGGFIGRLVMEFVVDVLELLVGCVVRLWLKEEDGIKGLNVEVLGDGLVGDVGVIGFMLVVKGLLLVDLFVVKVI